MSEKQYFGPLTLTQKVSENQNEATSKSTETCVLCDQKFDFPDEKKSFLTHLFMKHRLVIADVDNIPDLKAYITYWRLRFRDENLPYFCTTMLLDELPDGTKSKDEEYYLLSDVLPEDKELRMNLQHTELEKLMSLHQFEREDKNFEKECLFCRFSSKGLRSTYLNHLFEKHNFHIAKPENLIHIDQLINLIASKLDKLQCIYCEKYFKDRTILKEHMRKKGHKRINPDNKEYDKFFLVNYNGEKPPKPRHNSKSSNRKFNVQRKIEEQNLDKESIESDPDWSDWTEDNAPTITCLICEHKDSEYDSILKHMETQHLFSFTKATNNMDFYQKIKIVNFIRRQVHLKQCLACDIKFDSLVNLDKHMKDKLHCVLSKEKWDQPEYYFPTYEDDLFLCFIQDEDESWWSTDEQEKRNSMSETISKEMAMAVLKND